jgi:hypothetical protein
LKISKEKVLKITNEIRRKRKAATTRGVTRHRCERFKQDDKPDPDIIYYNPYNFFWLLKLHIEIGKIQNDNNIGEGKDNRKSLL